VLRLAPSPFISNGDNVSKYSLAGHKCNQPINLTSFAKILMEGSFVQKLASENEPKKIVENEPHAGPL
jgi:hypothetical protein